MKILKSILLGSLRLFLKFAAGIVHELYVVTNPITPPGAGVQWDPPSIQSANGAPADDRSYKELLRILSADYKQREDFRKLEEEVKRLREWLLQGEYGRLAAAGYEDSEKLRRLFEQYEVARRIYKIQYPGEFVNDLAHDLPPEVAPRPSLPV